MSTFTFLLATLFLPVTSAMGQALTDTEKSRLDTRFQSVVAEKYPEAGLTATGMTPDPIQNEGFAKRGETRYGAFIYTSDVQAVRAAGISVQLIKSDFVTAWVSPSELLALAQLSAVQWVDSGTVLKPVNDVTAGATGAEALQSGFLNNINYTGSGAMVCIIDSGIDWEHDDFRTGSNLNNSKIEYIWDLTLSAQNGEQTPAERGNSDFSAFDVGVEYTKSDIETSFGSSDPDVRSKDTDGHGTHVAGTAVASGNAHPNGKYEGTAPGSDLIVVKAGNESFRNMNLMSGLNYCGEVAEDQGKPVVVNMSLGGHRGPHDGTSPLASDIDNFSGSERLVVVSAGNEGSSGIHLQNEVDRKSRKSFDFEIENYDNDIGGKRNDVKFDIWLDSESEVKVNITTPSGISVSQGPGGVEDENTEDGAVFIGNRVGGGSNINGDRRVEIEVYDSNLAPSPTPGAWSVEIVNTSESKVVFHSWLYDRRIGEEGKINAGYTQETNNDSQYTVSIPGTASTALTVGAWAHRGRWADSTGSINIGDNNYGERSFFSSIGPRRDGTLKPEVTAPGQRTASALSSFDSSTDADKILPGGRHILKRGTSMAAPAVAGAVALLFQEDGSLSSSQIKDLITNQATTDDFTGATPNNTWGYGKLDVFRAMAELTGSKVPEREMLSYDESDSAVDSEILGGSNSEKLAVRLTPTINGAITGALLHVSFGNANQLSDSLNVEVWDDNGNGLPGTKQGNTVKVSSSALAEYSWNYIPLSDTDVSVAKNTDYHIVIYPDDPSGTLDILAETQSVDGRSSIMTGGSSNRLRHQTADDPDEIVRPKSGAKQGSWSALSGKDLALRGFVSSTQPTDLVVDISSLDFKLLDYPKLPTPVQTITTVSVENNGESVENLTASDFTITEDGSNIPIGSSSQRSCTITPPGQGINRRLADIVFIVDNSGSMGFEQDDVLQNIEDFVDELRARGVNSALGLTRYGQSGTGDLGQTGGGPIFENQGNLTTDDQVFKNDVLTRNITNGGNEPGYFAIDASVSNFTFRGGAEKLFVVATDETPAQDTNLADVDDALQAISNGDVTLYAATTSDLNEDFQPLTDATGGQIFDIFDPFATTVADAITSQTSSTYVITCLSPSDFEGSSASTTEREVKVEASASGVMDAATDTYNIASRPFITPSTQIKQVASTQQPPGQDIRIETEIQTFSDGEGSSISAKQNVAAEIFYRKAGSGDSFSSVSMSETTSGSFEGAIPASDVESPGMDFYIQATDGDGDRTTLPSSNAANAPLQTAVDQEPPTVSHDLIDGTTPGQDQTIMAEANDDGQVDQVTLFYRTQGDLAYSQLPMTNTSGTTYEATVPGGEITTAGIEYYIEAEDDFGITNSEGLADDPLVELSEGSLVSPTPSNRTLGLPNDVEITFNRVFRALEYEVQWATDASFPQAETDTIVVTDTTATLAGLSAGTTYHWRVRPVRNQAGPFSDTTQFETYPDQVETTVSQSFNDPSRSTSYRLMALPGNRNTELGSILEGSNGENWQAYRDSGDNLISYADGQSSNFVFEAGAGYWVLSKDKAAVSDTKPTPSIGSEEGNFQTTIPLHGGWNIISNPLDRGVPWSVVEDANGGELNSLWAFDGSYSEAPTLTSAVQGEAFYFLNDQGLDELVIPYPSTPASTSSSSKQEEPALVLETFQDGQKLSTAKVGLRTSAKDGLDRYDQYSPPTRFEAASLRFVADEKPRGEDAPRQKLLAHEYRSAPEDGAASTDDHEFDMRLTSTPNEPVRVKASGFEAFGGQEVVLLDPSTGQSYDLRSEESVQLTPTTKTTSMRLLVGDAQYVDSKEQEVTPEEVKLHGNFPNPFSQRTTITYALPDQQHHRLEVYDVMGRRIAVLENGSKRAGIHRVRWKGQTVASGVYLIRLEAEQATRTKKMTVVR